MAAISIVDDGVEGRWVARVGDELAGELVYDRDGTTVTLIHTGVEPAFEGRGIGSRLAKAALDDARARGLAVIPECPFVRSYLRRHPEYVDIVRPRPATRRYPPTR